jgi:hypothetical protein
MQVTCPSCVTLNHAGGKFCMRCGKPLPSAAPPVSPPAQQPPYPQPTPAQPFMASPPQPAYTPTAYTPAANSGASTGHRLIGPGGAAAILLFFLPWISVSCQGQPAISLSGWNLAAGGQVSTALGPIPLGAGSPEIFIMLLAAIACAVLGGLVFTRRMPDQAAAVAALAAVALSVLIFLSKVGNPQASQAGVDPSMLRIDPQIGLIGTLLAYVAIVVGAVLDLRHKP